MGITIVQKSDLSVRKKNPKVALVLAGGAVAGGAFKLGGLKALDDLLINRKTTDFDTYVGLSAGAVLAAPLAAGISPAEMIKSLEGKSDHFSRLRALDFYNPNFSEFLSRPAQFAWDVVLFLPGVFADVLKQIPELSQQVSEPLADIFSRPSLTTLNEILTPIGEALYRTRPRPSVLDYLPSGFFDNSSIEQYLRYNLKRAGLPNEFRKLHRKTGKELYISAMNLDTAERVVFGHDEDSSCTVSEAVQASTALPGFYKPARIGGVDYVDGGVRHTANIGVAIEHHADLIICYNPFRPFSNRVRLSNGRPGPGRPLADAGIATVLNQVFRTLLHSRLQYGLREYHDDPNFKGDIVVIEPKETDRSIFQLSALDYWQRIRAAQYGYVSVSQSIEENYDLLKQILDSYGITMNRRQMHASVERIRTEDVESSASVLTDEIPARQLSVA